MTVTVPATDPSPGGQLLELDELLEELELVEELELDELQHDKLELLVEAELELIEEVELELLEELELGELGEEPAAATQLPELRRRAASDGRPRPDASWGTAVTSITTAAPTITPSRARRLQRI